MISLVSDSETSAQILLAVSPSVGKPWMITNFLLTNNHPAKIACFICPTSKFSLLNVKIASFPNFSTKFCFRLEISLSRRCLSSQVNRKTLLNILSRFAKKLAVFWTAQK